MVTVGATNEVEVAVTRRDPRGGEPRFLCVVVLSALAVAASGAVLLQRNLARSSHAASDANSAMTHSRLVLSGDDSGQPTVPTGLTARAVGARTVKLSWHRDSRKEHVVSYSIYRDGRSIGTSKTSSFTDTTCQASYLLRLQDQARNAAGIASARSARVGVRHHRTPPPPVYPKLLPRPSSTPASAPSGFPDQTNTGYENAPGYSGNLNNCSNVVIHSNTTYKTAISLMASRSVAPVTIQRTSHSLDAGSLQTLSAMPTSRTMAPVSSSHTTPSNQTLYRPARNPRAHMHRR